MDSANVTRQRVVERINTRLVKQGQHCRQSQSARARGLLGAVFLVDLETNEVLDRHVDLEALARELGVLRPPEQISD